ncbi:MAG TPA: CopG family antitoxin [Gammaproteobacteria bacterium]|nr:CopG family antitoxin [Gammaproteobacteria bacterium]
MKNMRKTELPEEGSSPEVWDNQELGASEEFVRKSSPEREKMVDDNLGLQTISIRLQKSLIDDLKALAEEDGIGYQPYVRQALTRLVRREKAKHGKHVQAVK